MSGDKLADQVEAQIEARLGESWNRPTGLDVGRIFFDESAKKRYIDHLLSTMSTKLTGLKVVVDCANGAASTVAPGAYEQAGAVVIILTRRGRKLASATTRGRTVISRTVIAGTLSPLFFELINYITSISTYLFL